VLCKRQGIECVAEQLLASQEGILSLTLIVIHCDDFDSYIGVNIESSYSVTVLMTVYTIPCHDRLH
jgi:hypothetical protein